MKNTEVVLIAVLLIMFVLTPLLPAGLLMMIDNPFIRVSMLVIPLVAINVSYKAALISILVVGALFLERNTRKFMDTSGPTEWSSLFTRPLPENLPEMSQSTKKSYHQTPYLPDGLGDDGCGYEAPDDVKSDLTSRPLYATAHGDLHIHGEINRIVGNIDAPLPSEDIGLAGLDVANDSYASFA